MRIPFTDLELREAHDAWGANCGPAALAFFAQTSLDRVRAAMPDFPKRRYTNVTMMREALQRLGVGFTNGYGDRTEKQLQWDTHPLLLRIQWAGPWTAAGANQKWASCHTHWVATFWPDQAAACRVYDVNAGIQSRHEWSVFTAPRIVAAIPRANGDWWVTHVIRRAVELRSAAPAAEERWALRWRKANSAHTSGWLRAN